MLEEYILGCRGYNTTFIVACKLVKIALVLDEINSGPEFQKATDMIKITIERTMLYQSGGETFEC
jgi:hypothetical protein